MTRHKAHTHEKKKENRAEERQATETFPSIEQSKAHTARRPTKPNEHTKRYEKPTIFCVTFPHSEQRHVYLTFFSRRHTRVVHAHLRQQRNELPRW